MRVPFSWLKEYVAIPDKPEEAAQKLQRAGVPVERVEYLSKGISNVVAGKIAKMEPHPDADKLRVAQLDIGKENLQIVTGAPNVKQGDVVPVALVGASLAGGKRIQEAKLRGVASRGMMCSADELALGVKEFLPHEQQVGVMVLPSETQPGVDLSEMLGLNEAILSLEPFANRPDYLSIFGIAREASAIYGTPLAFPQLHSEGGGSLEKKIEIEIDDFESCSRYVARMIAEVRVKPSPLWMMIRLHAAGVRPVNNVVDITNYVLLELGQPLHAFDYQALADKKIRVRKARNSETFIGIDEKEYSLSENMLVISCGEKPAALAGIMGGKESEITDKTQEILLESAHFDAGTIRRASLKLGLRTESSRRFEKGLDPAAANWGSRRACHLLGKIGGKVLENFSDIHKKLPAKREISVGMARLKNILGVEEMNRGDVTKILTGLGFEIANQEPLLVLAPSLRCDIHEEIDVAEEVARHYGYDRIPSVLPAGMTTPARQEQSEIFDEKLRNILQGMGLTELITFSLGDPAYFNKLGLAKVAEIRNPLAEDRKALRPFLYPNLLLAIRKNLHVKNENLSFFEIGKVFAGEHEILEKRHAAVCLTGSLPWGKASSFFALKGMLEEMWESLHVSNPFELKSENKPEFHPHRLARISCSGKSIGFLGEIHPLLLESLQIEQPVFLLEMSVETLQSLHNPVPIFKPLPLYPESRRDISMIVDERVHAGEIIKLVQGKGGNLVENVKIFDLYQGPQVPQNKKSLAFSITYRSREKTLTDEEVSKLHQEIKETLVSSLEAQIRE